MGQQTYRITDEKTGRVIKMTGAKPPTDAEIRRAFASVSEPETPAQQPQAAPPAPQPGSVRRFLGNLAQTVLPSTTASDYIDGPLYALRHPIESAKLVGGAIRDAHVAQGGKAAESARGVVNAPNARERILRAIETVGHSAATVLPVFGPQAAAAGEQIGSGDVAGGLGRGVGLGANLASGRIASGVKNAVRVAPLKNANPKVAAAVEQGAAAGVPVDLATASGNAFVVNAQKGLGQTIGGSVVGGRAARRQGEALEAHGRDLADDVHPSAMTPESAGANTMDALHARVQSLSREADTAYAALRKFEEQAAPQTVQTTTTGTVAGGGQVAVPQPKQVKLAVDVKAAKDALRPLYDDLMRQANELNIPMQGGRARALAALDRLMNADDVASLSVVDAALGDLKALQRSLDDIDTSSASAITSTSVKMLDRQVVQTARNAGPDVLQALLDGRKATVGKYHANDVLESLGGEIRAGAVKGEPVGAFRRMKQADDLGLRRLQQVARETPQQLPQIGRAVLDDLFQTATQEGGLSRADGMFRAWNSLGNETKKLLFSKPGQVQSLDNFFLLAKKVSENPNRSGTALVSISGAELAAIGGGLATGNIPALLTSAGFGLTSAMLTKALYSPRLVRLLTQGLTIPPNVPAAAAWTNAFTKAAGEEGIELVPAR